MKISDFKIIGGIEYTNFPLIEFMYNEIIIEDCYGLKSLKEPQTIIDIGGNLGVFSVFARELFPNARIISIEALYDTYISLKENTKNHNIEVYNMALGDGSELFLDKCVEHSGANKFIKTQKSDISIKSKTLKEIFDELQIKGSYFIKMDIEGGELSLYEDISCISILKKCKYFTMEWHTSNILGYKVDKQMWDSWLLNIFKNFKIDGLGNYDSTGAIYRISK